MAALENVRPVNLRPPSVRPGVAGRCLRPESFAEGDAREERSGTTERLGADGHRTVNAARNCCAPAVKAFLVEDSVGPSHGVPVVRNDQSVAPPCQDPPNLLMDKARSAALITFEAIVLREGRPVNVCLKNSSARPPVIRAS
jgi:hypothetical protein